ncbi:thioredoxin family protein [Desulfonatronospira sp.]|uniref:thioredoxin family protein n=1 Tax=Desulfonatronospira sp. TaxID=1962951 RepID=UPI0025C1FA11|nr:thioredoxin family protein [Desulfonatronospira sp.]
MKKALAALIFVGAVFAIIFTHTYQMEQESAAIMESITQEGRVTMLNVGAEFCPPCQAMEPVLKEVQEHYQNQVYMPYLDMQKHSTQVQHLGVRTTPTQIFFDHQGREIYRHEGMLEKDEIKDKLDELLEKNSDRI